MPAQIGYSVNNLSELTAIPNTVRVTGYLRYVISSRAWYMFDSSAADAADGANIVSPNSGSGRWFRVKALTLPTEVPGLLKYVQDVIGVASLQSSTFNISYNSALGITTINLNTDTITNTHISPTANIAQAKIQGLTDALDSKASTNHTHASSQISDLSEAIDNRVAGLVMSSDNSVTFTYNNTNNTLDIRAVAAATNVAIKEDNVSEGSVNSFNFTGSAVDVSVTGSEATINISAPSSLSTESIVVTSSTLNVNASETVAFTAFPVGTFIRLTTNFPSRIRVYITSAYATADLSRPTATELVGEHGCVLECVTIASNLTLDLSPPAMFYTTVSGNLLYMNITNTDSTNRAITATLTTLKW